MEEIYIEVHVKLYKPIEEIAINFTVNPTNFTVNPTEDESEKL